MYGAATSPEGKAIFKTGSKIVSTALKVAPVAEDVGEVAAIAVL